MSTALNGDALDELLERCARRDADALRSLYARTAPQLLAILARMLGTRAAAEDALQDVFIRIWQQAGQFERSKGRAMAWMVTIARNRAIDLQRAGRPTVLLDTAELEGAEELRVEGPADEVQFGAAYEALRRCLDVLGTEQRQCLLLAYQRGFTHERISLSIGQPLGTVKSWVRRGLQSLRACMES
ncbi:MAG TPA: sigma-70 family RNA polymerase sigma factor [Steroidobacteraceae bacterium]|nr:sigma-70 family RNA polymerase sigma factor [Steroidobacteraceae bacterium]